MFHKDFFTHALCHNQWALGVLHFLPRQYSSPQFCYSAEICLTLRLGSFASSNLQHGSDPQRFRLYNTSNGCYCFQFWSSSLSFLRLSHMMGKTIEANIYAKKKKIMASSFYGLGCQAQFNLFCKTQRMQSATFVARLNVLYECYYNVVGEQIRIQVVLDL